MGGNSSTHLGRKRGEVAVEGNAACLVDPQPVVIELKHVEHK